MFPRLTHVFSPSLLVYRAPISSLSSGSSGPRRPSFSTVLLQYMQIRGICRVYAKILEFLVPRLCGIQINVFVWEFAN
jgi:hypothetical protein